MNTQENFVHVSVKLNCSQEHAWTVFTSPAHITEWNFASEDWICPSASNDLRAGGKFTSRMEARDGSMGFDFEGQYTDVKANELLEYVLADGRKVKVTFTAIDGGVLVEEFFEPENMHPVEFQKSGWQAILDQYKKHAENII